MKAILEFDLPEELVEYRYCIKGADYINAIREIVAVLRNKIKYEDDEDVDDLVVAGAVLKVYEKMYEKVFWICKEHGFSPWED